MTQVSTARERERKRKIVTRVVGDSGVEKRKRASLRAHIALSSFLSRSQVSSLEIQFEISEKIIYSASARVATNGDDDDDDDSSDECLNVAFPFEKAALEKPLYQCP